jgi:hypothetical protein
MQFIQYLIPAIFVGSVSVLVVLSFQKAKHAVHNWVNSQGCQLVSVEYRYLRTGPFFGQQGQGHLVYRVQMKDREQRVRIVWLRVGHWFTGMASDQVTAIWE